MDVSGTLVSLARHITRSLLQLMVKGQHSETLAVSIMANINHVMITILFNLPTG